MARVAEPDNQRLRQRTHFDPEAGLDRQERLFAFSAPRGGVDFGINIESRIRGQVEADQTVALLTWTTGEYEAVSVGTARPGRDQRFETDDVDNPAEYVPGSDGSVALHISTVADLDDGDRLVAQCDEITLD